MPDTETITVISQHLRVITPIPPDQRVEMRSKEGLMFTPDFIFAEITVYHDRPVRIEGLDAYSEVGNRTMRTDFTYVWSSDEHRSWEDKPPALLVEHAKALLARDWSKQ